MAFPGADLGGMNKSIDLNIQRYIDYQWFINSGNSAADKSGYHYQREYVLLKNTTTGVYVLGNPIDCKPGMYVTGNIKVVNHPAFYAGFGASELVAPSAAPNGFIG